MPFSGYTLPISLNAVATGGGVTPKSMSALRGKTVYDSGGTSYTTPSSGPFNLKDNFLNRSFTSPATVPDAPTNLTATAGNTQAILSWSAPTNNGGSAITGYTVKYSSGTVVTTTGAGTTSYTVTALTNGTPYTFTVTANNSVGSSTPSSFPSVTPTAPVNNLKITRTSIAYNSDGYSFTPLSQKPHTITNYSPGVLTVDIPSFLNYNDMYGELYGGYGEIYAYMTGGNSAPIYICISHNAFTGNNYVRLNNVSYGDGRNPNICVYFPNGVNSCDVYVRSSATDTGYTNGGTITISQTPNMSLTQYTQN